MTDPNKPTEPQVDLDKLLAELQAPPTPRQKIDPIVRPLKAIEELDKLVEEIEFEASMRDFKIDYKAPPAEQSKTQQKTHDPFYDVKLDKGLKETLKKNLTHLPDKISDEFSKTTHKISNKLSHIINKITGHDGPSR